MKKLNYVQKKLLKKVDLFNYKNERTERENTVIGRFNLKDHDEYRKYRKLAGSIQALAHQLKLLPFDDEKRIEITKQLAHRLVRLGVLVPGSTSLEDIMEIGVSSLCKRRLSVIIRKLKMAQHQKHAEDLCMHGHIRIGLDVIRDPATLVTRDMEDLITWAAGSKYKAAVADFRDARDDFDLLNV